MCQSSLTCTPAFCCPGLLCHLDDACISNPCNEGSNCDTNPVNGKAICTCPSGYMGPACNQDVDECSLGELTGVTAARLEKALAQPGASFEGCAFVLQEPTHVSMQENASTPKGLSSASVCRATQALAVRLMSMSASPTPARMMPPAWTRLGSSSASACPVSGQPCGLSLSAGDGQGEGFKCP